MKWGLGAAAVVLAAALAWWAFDDAPTPPDVSPQPAAATPPTSSTARDLEARVVADPPSLRGAERDGEIGWLPDGTVRVDLALRRRFDHLLSALGEVSLAQVRSRLETELTPVAAAPRVAAVLALFDRYVAYLEAAGRVQPDADPRKRLAQAHELRVTKLGSEVARAFYEDEERGDEWAISRQELLRQGGATREALAALDEKLPPEARQLAREAAQLQDAVAQTAQFDAENVGAEERRRQREAKFGSEAATRLEALDAERAKWNARVDAFKALRAQLEPLDANDEKQLEELLQRDFSEEERRRVRALLSE